MSALTPFGPISYDSDLSDWQGAHAIRHRAEAQESARRGRPLTAPLLDGTIDADWFGRHSLHHRGLSASARTGTANLLAEGWHDEKSFYDWHRLHTLLHEQTDHLLGIV